MDAKEVIARLCKLQADVYHRIGDSDAADCFCGEGGFWNSPGYDGTFHGGYRNDGVALEFIEQAVNEKLAGMSGVRATEQNKQPPAEAGERVGSVTISDFRGYENVEFQYSGNLPNGTHSLYTSQTTATQAAVAAAMRNALDSFAYILDNPQVFVEAKDWVTLAKDRVANSIPAEATAALEKICMEVAKQAAEFGCYPCDDDELLNQLRAIVTAVIEKGK